MRTTSKYSPVINKPNKMNNLKKGDKVVMCNCGEAYFPKYAGKIWTCKEDSFVNSSGCRVVFLEDFSGTFITKYLQIVILDK